MGGGGAIINLSRLIPQMPTASAAIAAGSAGKKKDGGRGRSREGERGDGRKRERSSEKEARRKNPDIFIALPTSFLHPSFHSLFLGKGGEKGEMMGGMGKKPSALTYRLVTYPSHHRSAGPFARPGGRFGGAVVW